MMSWRVRGRHLKPVFPTGVPSDRRLGPGSLVVGRRNRQEALDQLTVRSRFSDNATPTMPLLNSVLVRTREPCLRCLYRATPRTHSVGLLRPSDDIHCLVEDTTRAIVNPALGKHYYFDVRTVHDLAKHVLVHDRVA